MDTKILVFSSKTNRKIRGFPFNIELTEDLSNVADRESIALICWWIDLILIEAKLWLTIMLISPSLHFNFWIKENIWQTTNLLNLKQNYV